MVTAETAVVLPAIITMLLFVLLAASYGIAQSRNCEAARSVARLEAVSGGSEGGNYLDGNTVAQQIAGAGAQTVVSHSDRWVTVSVSQRIGGRFGVILPTVTCQAKTLSEAAF